MESTRSLLLDDPLSFAVGSTTPPLTNDRLTLTTDKESTFASTVNIIDTTPSTPPGLEVRQLKWQLPEELPRMLLQSSNLASFTLFPFLPKELRIKIWKLAAIHPRIVQITYDHPTESLVSLSPAPALLATCGEARDELLPLFKQLSLPNSACEAIIYLNLEVDTCYVRRATTSMEDASPYTANFTTTKAIFGNNDSKELHPLSFVKHLAIDSSLIDSPVELRLLWGDWDQNSKPQDLKLKCLETFKIVYAPIGPRPSLRKIRGHPRISYDDPELEGFTILSKEDRWERRRRHHPINNGEWMTESPFSPRYFSYRQGGFVTQDPVFYPSVHVCGNAGQRQNQGNGNGSGTGVGDVEKDFYCPGCHVPMSLGAYRAYISMMERDVRGWKGPVFEGVKYERVEERDTEYHLWG
ncbi:hypothetical protein sscle_06g053920 [Sclerotinia sclerotiorum 1980 UF-70]|uniref:2EXR domain-containing protein n=2 Tax=Sclerotinia sclerotiorum (strain ATCC 18683 / 1980 / Ss-1) TaxID=665079 RepID=A0A1D9Q747_SCLS1|nr:hypothetical protein sscle_06g053920 [Sclerotinia sclerotiorum 1980 UF-70]